MPKFTDLSQCASRRKSVTDTDYATLHARFDRINRRSAWTRRISALSSGSGIDSNTSTVSLAPANRVSGPQLRGYNVLSVTSVRCRRRRCIWLRWVAETGLRCVNTGCIAHVSELPCCSSDRRNRRIATIWNRLGPDGLWDQDVGGHVTEHALVRNLVHSTDYANLCPAGASDWVAAIVLPQN